MKYSFVIERPARKFIRKQNKEQQERILKAIYKLPDEGDISPLKSHEGIFRLRVGDVRVVYTVHQNILTVQVLDTGPRGDIYKRY